MTSICGCTFTQSVVNCDTPTFIIVCVFKGPFADQSLSWCLEENALKVNGTVRVILRGFAQKVELTLLSCQGANYKVIPQRTLVLL